MARGLTNQSIKYSFIDKKDNLPDTNASGLRCWRQKRTA